MKTFFEPFNPEKLPPPAPGYRYLGKDEERKPTDETMTYRNGPWSPISKCLSTISHIDSWTLRRALCVDDPSAPTPADWAKYPIRAVSKGDYPVHGDVAMWVDGVWIALTYGVRFAIDGYVRAPAYDETGLIDKAKRKAPSVPEVARHSAPVLKPGQSIVIAVYGNAALSTAVQLAAFGAGYAWAGSGCQTPENLRAECLFLHDEMRHKIMTHGTALYAKESDETTKRLHLDAKTDMGLLIDLLAQTPSVPAKPVGPTINGYVGAYTRLNGSISFGCAQLSIPMLRKVCELMSTKWTGGNRFVGGVTLDSSVSLSRADIGAILAYVDKVNKV